jgi:L-ascorbate metabolism protein UlaG (beta-lactamase superfamily)
MRGGRRGGFYFVIPAQAGIHFSGARAAHEWVPAFAGNKGIGCIRTILRVLCGTSACSALKHIALLLVALAMAFPAWAACTGVVAGDGTRLWRAAASEGTVSISFLGHASFLIESPGGVRAVTDYNDLIRAPTTPDIVTMNVAHTTHWTDHIEPGVKFVLRGWDPDGGVANHNVEFRDLRVHNVPTNIRGFGSTRYNGNSIFVFETGGLCIAHLGHLHHTLSEAHLADLGAIDIVMVPVDGAFTLNQDDMVAVLQQLKPKIALPMHFFGEPTLARFLARAGEHYRVRRLVEPQIRISRADLPNDPELLVMPGR